MLVKEGATEEIAGSSPASDVKIIQEEVISHTSIKTLVSGVDAVDMNLVVELIILNNTTILTCEGTDSKWHDV